MTKYRTITLTDRAPVKIRENEWPIIAQGEWYDSHIHSQANREHHIKVRQHEDGRAIVYGVTHSSWQGARGWAGGELLAADDDIVAAIKRVGSDGDIDEIAIRECIADLPALEI